ncbi:uncharacterized protein LOC122820680 [Gambusia affinis]|uniref:uncharacterized protein LOC122820680 n=1 Tax=Gambusia affinis TaxID=33528 RepID=UPI001CDBB064|nr:uncharacterized protein LOC122820680 [Gambusia affinis]
MAVLKLIFLLSSWSITGVAAKDSPVMFYQLKNSSVCLHVKKQQSYTNGQWKRDATIIVSGTLINPTYEKRVKFHPKNMTLCISELTESDTGLYKASYPLNFTEVSESYQVVVQGMIPRPVMAVIPENHSNLSAESCDFTVNCSIQDDWLGSICHKNGCRTSQRSFSKVNISIFAENTVVVCSGNNHVSTNNISQNIPTACFVQTNVELKEEIQTFPKKIYIFIIVIAAAVFVFVILPSFFIARKYRKYKHNQEATSVAQLIQSGPLEAQQLSEPRASTSSSEADPSYENVEANQPIEIGVPRLEQVIGDSQGVETEYSVPRKAASCVQRDKKRDENTQKTPASGRVSVNTDQSSTQTETLDPLHCCESMEPEAAPLEKRARCSAHLCFIIPLSWSLRGADNQHFSACLPVMVL